MFFVFRPSLFLHKAGFETFTCTKLGTNLSSHGEEEQGTKSQTAA